MPKINTDHVVFLPTGGLAAIMMNHKFECLHCDAKFYFNLPSSITFFVDVGDAFTKEHKRCKPK